ANCSNQATALMCDTLAQHDALPVSAEGSRDIGPAMQGVASDKSAVQIERGEHFENAGNLVAIGGLPLSQRHACACRPDIDHMQRRSEERRVGKECRARWAPDD